MSDEAGDTILAVLAEGTAEIKVLAAHAALAAAQRIEKDGRKEAVAKLRKAAAAAGVPARPAKNVRGK